MMRAAKVDQNQAEIVKAFRQMGAEVEHVFQLKNHCDLDVYYRGVTVKVEVKMPGAKLSPGEQSFREKVERQGCKYAVIETIDQARELIREIYTRTPDWRAPCEK